MTSRLPGKILDINGNILADNRTVCTVSVIHSQIKDPEKVIQVLAKELTMDEETIRKKVEKKFLLLKEFEQMWKKQPGMRSVSMHLRE